MNLPHPSLQAPMPGFCHCCPWAQHVIAGHVPLPLSLSQGSLLVMALICSVPQTPVNVGLSRASLPKVSLAFSTGPWAEELCSGSLARSMLSHREPRATE